MKWNKYTTTDSIPFETTLVIKVEYTCVGIGQYYELYLCEKALNSKGEVYFLDNRGECVYLRMGKLVEWVDLGGDDERS